MYGKNSVKVIRRNLERVYSIFMYLYNKNVLEYGELVVTDANSRILNIEGQSSIYAFELLSCLLTRQLSFIIISDFSDLLTMGQKGAF